ncbi:MAG: 4-hydroxythreonine-4-phosphate dehydrogenase PdxA [Solitalea-like symbiont of Acarus siro]
MTNRLFLSIKTDFKGQTEFFESLANSSHHKKSLMFFISEQLKLALVTNHTIINDISKKINTELIVSKATILYESLKKDFWISAPKIAILGLNPHSGDRGLLGKDEEMTIKPAIEELTKKGIIAHGPFPADSFFARGLYRSFDATLAMYHDQGLIPFKLIADDEGVNFTAGLEFIRTSPTHGVAYNIAGQGKADTTSFKQAIYAL